MFIDKLDILKDILKEKYKNKINANITIKDLIKLLDEVDKIYIKENNERIEEIKKQPKVEVNIRHCGKKEFEM
jgi:hypothetical protein